MFTRRGLVAGFAALALWALPAGLATGAAGDLDPTFGSGGTSVVFPGAFGTATALAPDGKIVIAGVSTLGQRDFAVARLASNGSVDTAFGVQGARLFDFGTSDDLARAVALTPTGRIVLAGSSGGGPGARPSDFAALRLLPDGSPDNTFTNSPQDFPGSNAGEAGALAPDGKVVLAGFSDGLGLTDFAIARLTASGIPDTGFGVGGKSQADFAAGLDQAHAVALAPDGRIVVAGDTGDGLSGARDVAVLRLKDDGSVDAGFGVMGRSRADFGGSDSGRAVALAPDGKIVVAGSSGGDFAVARLNPNGYFDTAFGAGGKSLVDVGPGDDATAVALAANGKIVVAGSSGGDFGVARLQPNGLLDTTFGRGGRVTIDFGGSDGAGAVALTPDGRIVVAGSSSPGGFAVARLQGDPSGPGGPGAGGPGGLGTPPRCAGTRATIVGTRAADRLRGTRKRDVIAGLGGNDTIRALGGDDIVCGGPGSDRLLGGPGADTLRGGGGADRVLGGAGRDRLLGGPGRDRLAGGLGRDLLRGGPGRDVERP